MAFHEVRFPTGISLGFSGGPERRTKVIVLGSGAEERNARWAASRRRCDAGYGIKSVAACFATGSVSSRRYGVSGVHGRRDVWCGITFERGDAFSSRDPMRDIGTQVAK